MKILSSVRNPLIPQFILVCAAVLLMAGTAQAQPVQGTEISRQCTYGDCVNGEGTLEIKTNIGVDSYKGNFKDGKYHGYGKLTYMVSVTERAYYDGTWEDGIRVGRGTHWNGKGDLYVGEWQNDKRHGRGSYFVGLKDWSENKYSAHWLSENVENYTGDFRNDHYQGEGTYRWPNGQRYVGSFFANEKHGPGVFHYTRGTIRPQVWEYGEFIR